MHANVNIINLKLEHMWQEPLWFGLVYSVQRHFQQYFNYIVAISLIGGGTPRKQPTYCKSLTNLSFIT